MTALELAKLLLEAPEANVYFSCDALDDVTVYEIEAEVLDSRIHITAPGIDKVVEQLKEL